MPIPRRCNVTMLLGTPLLVQKVEEPTDAQVDELHSKLLDGMKALFDAHKASLGWEHKQIRFE